MLFPERFREGCPSPGGGLKSAPVHGFADIPVAQEQQVDTDEGDQQGADVGRDAGDGYSVEQCLHGVLPMGKRLRV